MLAIDTLVTLTTLVGPLYGTLLVPEGVRTPCPVALIIAGSGPTDRNGNTGQSVTNNSLRFLAEGLALHGIASLRYDRRGVGESPAGRSTQSGQPLGKLLPEALAELDTLAAGHHIANVEPLLMPLFRLSVQDYLLSVFAIDPAKEIARLTVPILIVSGTSDRQVPVAEGDILARAAPRPRRLIITDMNHVLKSCPRAISTSGYRPIRISPCRSFPRR
jgi:pimeloyl-ACP methyl ester carboxylesterase